MDSNKFLLTNSPKTFSFYVYWLFNGDDSNTENYNLGKITVTEGTKWKDLLGKYDIQLGDDYVEASDSQGGWGTIFYKDENGNDIDVLPEDIINKNVKYYNYKAMGPI